MVLISLLLTEKERVGTAGLGSIYFSEEGWETLSLGKEKKQVISVLSFCQP